MMVRHAGEPRPPCGPFHPRISWCFLERLNGGAWRCAREMDENSRETVTLPALAHIPKVLSSYIIERGETIVSDNSTVKVGSMVRVRFSDGEEEYTIVGGE